MADALRKFTATVDGVTFTRSTRHTYTHAVVAAPAPGSRHYDAAAHGVPKFASFHKSLRAAQKQASALSGPWTSTKKFIVAGAGRTLEPVVVCVEVVK